MVETRLRIFNFMKGRLGAEVSYYCFTIVAVAVLIPSVNFTVNVLQSKFVIVPCFPSVVNIFPDTLHVPGSGRLGGEQVVAPSDHEYVLSFF